MRDGESNDTKRAEPGFTLWVFVLPRDVVPGAGREDGDVVPGGEMLGDEAAVPFRASGDVGPEPVDDAGELHRAARVS
jgi:hypothetical protein